MNRLKELRKEKGYTQVKMQMLTGIDQSDYAKIENGKRYYTFEQCRKIALALETSMDYLAGLTDEKKPLNKKACDALASQAFYIKMYGVFCEGLTRKCYINVTFFRID